MEIESDNPAPGDSVKVTALEERRREVSVTFPSSRALEVVLVGFPVAR